MTLTLHATGTCKDAFQVTITDASNIAHIYQIRRTFTPLEAMLAALTLYSTEPRDVG